MTKTTTQITTSTNWPVHLAVNTFTAPSRQEYPSDEPRRTGNCLMSNHTSQSNTRKRKPRWLLDILAGRRQKEACKICKYKPHEQLVAVRTGFVPPHYKPLKAYSREELRQEVNSHTILCTWCFRIYMSKKHAEQPIPSFDVRNPCCGRLCNTQHMLFKKYQLCGHCHAHHAHLRTQRYDMVNAYKRSFNSCHMCNTQITRGNEMCFDLDHVDPFAKEHNVSHLIRRLAPLSIIRVEMYKCRLLCCLCHVKHTKTQQHIFQRQDFIDKRKQLRKNKHGMNHNNPAPTKWHSESDSSDDDHYGEEPVIRSTYNPLDDPEPLFKAPPLAS